MKKRIEDRRWRIAIWSFAIFYPLSSVVAFAASAITVHPDQPIGPPIVGYGAQLNPYVYCTPNWGDVNDENVKDYERKVKDLAPQHVRVFFMNEWFTAAATDPVAKSDRRIRGSFIRTCQLAQDAGATINVTLWYGKFSLREKGELPAPGLFESTARQFAEALHDLIDVRELTAIKYVTIQNEVNGEEPHGRRFKMDPEEYESIIRLFDTELKRIGLRDKVKLVGGDLVMREQELWVPFLGQHLGDVCDGWSMHAYWDYWDEEKIVRRLGGFAELIAALPAAQQKPLYATEFGIRGRDRNGEKNDPGDGENGSPIATTPLHGNQMARFVLESINRGYVAAVAWNMDDSLYDHAMKYGLMGTPKDGWPLKPAYHVMQLFTHATKPGWRAVKVEGAKEGVLVAAMAGSKNEVSVFVLNTRDQPNHVDINGLEGTFQLHTWNGNGKPSVREGDFFELGGKAGFGIPPFGMVVLSRR